MLAHRGATTLFCARMGTEGSFRPTLFAALPQGGPPD